MSFSFSVPVGTVDGFTDRAKTAKAALEAQYEGNDYQMTQLSSGLADEGITAAQGLIDSGKLGASDGQASGTISGHYATDGKSASSVSVSISVSPAAK